MGRLENQSRFSKLVFDKQYMMMTMQCTNSTRFSSSGFAGCHNSTPLTRDLALEIRLMVPEGGSASDPSRFVWILATPLTRVVVRDHRENTPGAKVEGRGIHNKATPSSDGRSKI